MGRGSRKTHLGSQVSKRMEVVCWTVLWLDGFIRWCSSLQVYDIPISLQEKTVADLPNTHKLLCGKVEFLHLFAGGGFFPPRE